VNKPKNLWKVGPGGIVIQINVNDPDTPALIWDSIKKRHSATYDCGVSTGELDCGAGPELTEQQVRWLEQFEDHVNEAYEWARKDLPEYN
jgi:hypothetical protein